MVMQKSCFVSGFIILSLLFCLPPSYSWSPSIFISGRSAHISALHCDFNSSRVQASARVVRKTSRGRDGKGAATMFFGPGENFFGIGAPEAAVIFAVGYFLLGPRDLYKLSKSIGQVFGQFKDYGVSTISNFQETMEAEIRSTENALSNASRDLRFDIGRGNNYLEEEEFEDIYVDDEGNIVGDESSTDQYSDETDVENESDNRFDRKSSGKEAESSENFFAFRANASEASKKEASSLKPSFETVGAPSTSKFQSQLSSDWNERILESNNESGRIGKSVEVNEADLFTERLTKPELSIEEQFDRLEKLATLEEERSNLMQKLDDLFEKKMRAVRKELTDMIDEDFKSRRSEINN